jgi:hypothetical protein
MAEGFALVIFIYFSAKVIKVLKIFCLIKNHFKKFSLGRNLPQDVLQSWLTNNKSVF